MLLESETYNYVYCRLSCRSFDSLSCYYSNFWCLLLLFFFDRKLINVSDDKCTVKTMEMNNACSILSTPEGGHDTHFGNSCTRGKRETVFFKFKWTDILVKRPNAGIRFILWAVSAAQAGSPVVPLQTVSVPSKPTQQVMRKLLINSSVTSLNWYPEMNSWPLWLNTVWFDLWLLFKHFTDPAVNKNSAQSSWSSS